jgi:hypothetical protein
MWIKSLATESISLFNGITYVNAEPNKPVEVTSDAGHSHMGRGGFEQCESPTQPKTKTEIADQGDTDLLPKPDQKSEPDTKKKRIRNRVTTTVKKDGKNSAIDTPNDDDLDEDEDD